MILGMCQENCQSPLTSSSKENDSSDSAPENKDTMTDTQKLAQKLRKEMEDLQFRTSYGWQRSDGKVVNINTNPLFDAVNAYPQQDDFQPTHMANYNPKMGAFASTSLHNGHVSPPYLNKTHLFIHVFSKFSQKNANLRLIILKI